MGKRGRCADLDWDEAADDVLAGRLGPLDRSEVVDWPARVWRLLGDGASGLERLLRCRDALADGVLFSSDYSGMGCERDAMSAAFDASADAFGAFEELDIGRFSPRIEFTRSCDHNPVARYVLLYLAKEMDASQSCVFSSIEDQIPLVARDHIESLTPPRGSDLATWTEANRLIDMFLMENRELIYKATNECPCLVHERNCPLVPPAHVASRCLRVNSAGNACWAWSSVGIQAREADSTEAPWFIWLRARQRLAELEVR